MSNNQVQVEGNLSALFNINDQANEQLIDALKDKPIRRVSPEDLLITADDVYTILITANYGE